MKCMDIYYNLDNPIEDKDKFNRILEAYGNPNGMYAGLATASNRDYNTEIGPGGYYEATFNEKDKDKFYSKMTNLWINKIKDMSREEFVQKINTESFYKLRHKYIMDLEEVQTKEEADKVLKGEGQNKDIQEALSKYGWTYDQAFWEHVTSSKVSSLTKNVPVIDHRLYVNPDSNDLYEFMNYFVDKCEEKDMNYYFKFCKDFTRDDAFVIYSSTEELTKYVDILKEIGKEHPDLVSRFKEPPILSGKVNDYIGYGSEPSLLNKEKVIYSFNSLRENKVLKPAIRDVTRNWIKDNMDKELVYRNEKMTFKNLVSHMAVDEIVNNLSGFIKGKSTTEAIEKNGICEYDLHDKRVLKDIYNIVDKKMEQNLNTYCDYGIGKVEKITLPLRNNHHYHFYDFAFERVLNDLPRRIAKNDKKYIEDLKSEIYKNAQNYKININKFCLDNYALREFQLEDYNNLRKEQNNKINWEKDKKEELDKMFNVENKSNQNNKKSELDKMFDGEKKQQTNIQNTKK